MRISFLILSDLLLTILWIIAVNLITIAYAAPALKWPTRLFNFPPTTAQLELPSCLHTSSYNAAAVEDSLYPHKQISHLATADDLVNGCCGEIVLIFARGTGNAGNIGSTLGRPLFEAMKAGLNVSVIAQGVQPYPAVRIDYLKGGSEAGARSMVRITKRALCQCPSAMIVLAGFRFAKYPKAATKYAHFLNWQSGRTGSPPSS